VTRLTFVFVHGGWHDGSAWSAVAERLEALGHTAHAPTISGNGKVANRTVDHAGCTASIVDYVLEHDLQGIVLVGHSYGGTIVQKAAEVLVERIQRLVFFNAFVLLHGQCLLDETPQNVEAVERGAAESGDDTYLPPFEAVRDVFFNTVAYDEALRLYTTHWSPQPVQPFRDRLNLELFYRLELPKTYLTATEDIRVPMPDFSWHPRFSNRLGRFRFLELPGDHEAMLTNPSLLADRLVAGGRP
jgi:pimeloyl-ACP methyl ester carboxylesterase